MGACWTQNAVLICRGIFVAMAMFIPNQDPPVFLSIGCTEVYFFTAKAGGARS